MQPTVEDLVRRAADEPDRREAAIGEALQTAARERAWGSLLSGLRRAGLATPAWLERILPAALAEAETEAAPWGFREIARAQAEDLGDLSAAAATLDRAEQVMSARRNAMGLCLIAEERADTLADVEGVSRCLTRALAMPNNSSDISHIATTHAALLGDTAGARALLDALPPPDDASTVWSIGNARIELGQPEEATSLLLAALDRLSAEPERWRDPCWQARTLAHAARTWEDEGAWRRGKKLAEALATTPEQLLDLAESWMDAGERSQAGRRVLAEAERRATAPRRGRATPLSDDLRHRLAPLYGWFGDAEAAERLAPAGLRPGELASPCRALPGLEPDPSGLLDHLRAQLTEAQLRHIAAADYGSEFNLHLEHLHRICATGRLPITLRWNPGEVLRLCRWASGERVDHVVRAFCAAILLLCSDQDPPANDTPILVESALQLGGPAPARAEGLFTWLYRSRPEPHVDEQLCALWGLALLIAARSPGEPRLHTVADHLERLSTIDLSGEPATLTSAQRYTLRAPLWSHLIAELLEPAAARPAIARILALR